MVYSLAYRRPRHVSYENRNSLTSEEGKSSLLSGSSDITAGIPDALAFDRIINGGTCPVSFSLCDLLKDTTTSKTYIHIYIRSASSDC